MGPTFDDRPAGQLDDHHDRAELRSRYYGLLQELRILLPGTQVLVAFLLTVPFNDRFAEVDAAGRALYGTALGAGLAAIVAFVAPAAFHRLGARRERAHRLVWSIRAAVVGLAGLALALDAALALVARHVFGPGPGLAAGVAGAVALVATWVVLPRLAIGRSGG